MAKAFMAYVGDSMHLRGRGQFLDYPFSSVFEQREDFDAQEVIEDIVTRVTGE